MATLKRYLYSHIERSLKKKMVFMGGPRQVGKTTLALQLLGGKANEKHPAYLNWDNPLVPPKIRKMELPTEEKLLILDEIHKYKKWRNLVKGIWDTEHSFRKILVTGSARLDYYRRGGDSLANRYLYFRLHPLSLNEISQSPKSSDLMDLLQYSGFPEPFFIKNPAEHRIWQRDRLSRIVSQDLRDLENVREISIIQELVDLLPEKVGSPLSIKSIKEDLEVDDKTIKKWLFILENLYVCFRIAPFGSKKIRAVKKENKLYLWDWSGVPDLGFKFENLVASQLLKYCHFIEDTEGFKMELRFLRDTDKREVDFVVLKDSVPLFAVECKSGEKAISRHIHYFRERTQIPHFYQVHMGVKSFQNANITVLPFIHFCQKLKLP